tara:strand:- start:871 stop:990 length:120 start_codon:yes stop_codon:yes gene_type:complete
MKTEAFSIRAGVPTPAQNAVFILSEKDLIEKQRKWKQQN